MADRLPRLAAHGSPRPVGFKKNELLEISLTPDFNQLTASDSFSGMSFKSKYEDENQGVGLFVCTRRNDANDPPQAVNKRNRLP